MKRYYPCFLLLFLLLHPSLRAEINLSIDRNPVYANESFQLFFEADDSPDGDPDFSPLQQYFDILNTSQNNSISIINGNYQRSIKWTLQLMPKQVGEIIVPAIGFGDDSTEPFQISVKAASQSGAAPDRGLIFELSADRESVVVQGQVIVTMRLMSDTNISAYEIGELVVDRVDVVREPLGDVRRFQTRLGDRPYLVLEQKFALFPQEIGSLEIKPVLGQVRLSASSGSVFDPFQTRGEVRSVYSPPLKIQVTGIDPAFNGNYWLPAASLKLSEEWQEDMDGLVAGEPVTRTIRLVADGLTAAQLPTLIQGQVDGLKQYPDQAVLDDQRSDSGIIGVRQEKVALIPTAGGKYILPEITVPWWNIESGRQEIARIPSRTITVAETMQSQPLVSKESVLPQAVQDEVSQQPRAVQQASSFWVWLSVLLACGWLANAIFWKWRQQRDSQSDQSLEPPRISLRHASHRLQQACQQNRANDAREALLNWARALPVSTEFHNLHQVSAYFGAPLKSQIEIMNNSLYGESTQSWQGAQLWKTCQAIASELGPDKSVESGGLPALNPIGVNRP